MKKKYLIGVMIIIAAVILPFVGKTQYASASENFTIKQVEGEDNVTQIWFKSDGLTKEKYGPKDTYAYLSADNGINWMKTSVGYDDEKDYYIISPYEKDPNANLGRKYLLTPGTVYQMYVVNQNGEKSETIEVATGIEYDPDADDAKKYEIRIVDCTEDTCTLSWDAVEGANSYLLATGESGKKKLVVTDTTSYTIEGKSLPFWNKNKTGMLDDLDAIYVYPCVTINDLCFTSYYAIGNIDPAFRPSKPKVTWEWNEFRDLIEFKIKTNYSHDNTASYMIECYDLKTGKKVPSKRTDDYCITNTFRDRIYKFRVKQAFKHRKSGKYYDSKWSDYIYALPVPYFDMQRTSDGNIKVTWNKISSATGYDIYVKKGGSKKKIKVASLGKNKTSYTIKKVNGAAISKNSKYDICVVTKKKVGKKTYVSDKNYMLTIY